jgi:acetylornithine deacetylase/succinyl-diaminopimelate desuccinylase-like protein
VSGRRRASGERRLRDRLAGRRAALGDLAARLVRIPSDGPDHDEREVVATLASAAFELGLPAGEILAAEPGRPNLVIRIAGARPGRRLVLNGHTDTKPPGDRARWPGDPWAGELRDGRLHGLGAADMKGALAAMLHAAAALCEEGLPAHGELVLVFSADEEGSGTLGLAHVLAATDLAADAAIIGEPSGIDDAFDRLVIGARGFYGFTLRAAGLRRHSGLPESSGPGGAIAALVRAVDRLPAAVDFGTGPSEAFPLGPSVAITAIEAGVAAGIVPDEATARGEVRTVPGMTHVCVTDALRTALDLLRDDAGARLAVTLEPDPEIWPASAIDAGEPIVTALAAATAAVLGRAPRPGIFPGATEAHLFAARGIPCVPAFGPGRLAAAHVPDESVALAEIEAAAAIYAFVAARFLG